MLRCSFSSLVYVCGESPRGALCSVPAHSETTLLAVPEACCSSGCLWLGLVTLWVSKAGTPRLDEKGTFSQPRGELCSSSLVRGGDALFVV